MAMMWCDGSLLERRWRWLYEKLTFSKKINWWERQLQQPKDDELKWRNRIWVIKGIGIGEENENEMRRNTVSDWQLLHSLTDCHGIHSHFSFSFPPSPSFCSGYVAMAILNISIEILNQKPSNFLHHFQIQFSLFNFEKARMPFPPIRSVSSININNWMYGKWNGTKNVRLGALWMPL